jgi:hypothetical protein
MRPFDSDPCEGFVQNHSVNRGATGRIVRAVQCRAVPVDVCIVQFGSDGVPRHPFLSRDEPFHRPECGGLARWMGEKGASDQPGVNLQDLLGGMGNQLQGAGLGNVPRVQTVLQPHLPPTLCGALPHIPCERKSLPENGEGLGRGQTGVPRHGLNEQIGLPPQPPRATLKETIGSPSAAHSMPPTATSRWEIERDRITGEDGAFSSRRILLVQT